MSIILSAFIITLIMVCTGIPKILAGEYQIVALVSQKESPYKEVVAGFQKTITGQRTDAKCNVFVMEGDKAQIAQKFHDIKKIKPNIIFTVGTTPTLETLRLFHDIPIIATLILDDAMIMRARNATGVVLGFPIETQFDLLKKFLPEARTIGVMYNPSENQEKIQSAKTIARQMGLNLQAVAVDSPKDIPHALKVLANGTDVLWGIHDALVYNSLTAKQILLFSFRNHIPFTGLSSAWVKAGALYSPEYDFYDIGVQCAEKATKIMQGTKVSSLSVSLPRKLLYTLNLRTARYMKLKFREEHIHNAYQIFDE